jgi:hypothetical protein
MFRLQQIAMQRVLKGRGMSRRPTMRSKVVAACAIACLSWACGDFTGTAGSATGPRSLDGGNTAADIAAFNQTVYPVLTAYCSECHAGLGPGSPHIAAPSVTTAYHAVVDQGKVSLANPDRSRLVQRLVAETHHCWSDCATDGALMEQKIAEWAEIVDFGSGGVSIAETLSSNSVALGEGVEDTSSDRYTNNLVLLYEFKEGAGAVVADASGVEPAARLNLSGDYEWMPNWGITFNEGKGQASTAFSAKLYDRIAHPFTGSQQYTVEAWINTASIDQDGPARIVSYSRDNNNRNFTVGQDNYNLDFRNRSMVPAIDENGTPSLSSYDADEDLQADVPQHIVVTYDPFNGRRMYIDAEFTDDWDEQREPGFMMLWNWDRDYNLVVGNERNNSRPWEGQIRLVAIYDQALTDEQIRQNFEAGVGKRLVLRFDISRWTSPGSSLEFIVSELDAGSYLFCEPTYVGREPDGSRVSDIRVAVNGVVGVTGQAFRTLDTQLTGTKQELSRVCSVIEKQAGPDGDVFTIVFGELGGFSNVVAEVIPPPPPIVASNETRPELGMRDFGALFATMSEVTGVPLDDVRNPGDPNDELAGIEQSLPSEYDARAYVTSQQVTIAKVALAYCDALVDSSVYRTQFFGPAIDFGQPAGTLFGGADGDAVKAAFYDQMIASYDPTLGGAPAAQPLLDQPTRTEVYGHLDDLVATLLANGNDTPTITKGMCGAVLSSAAVIIH